MGYTPNEVLGRTPFDFMPKEIAEKIAKEFEEIANIGIALYDNKRWHRLNRVHRSRRGCRNYRCCRHRFRQT